MLTKLTKFLSSFTSHSPHTYDLITIGPYANRIAKAIFSFGDSPLAILTVE
jgi:galactose mutarotase-like enzyme